jgi:hypothetical protein
MAGTFYKYAERDADSQINWAEVGKGLSDMLAETNRVREEKKDALDAAQRETMNYLAETPNGEDATARKTVLEYSDQASNRMRIANQLLKNGQMSPKDYITFRQNVTDNTNLIFNANKVYQENFAETMQRSRDGISSALEPDRWKDAEILGNWADTGFFIGADGTVMAGKMIEKEVDGKKVRTLDQTPGNLRNVNTINKLLVGKIDKYKYEEKVDSFVDALGKDEVTTLALGTYSRQGIGTTIEDITKREYILPGDKPVLLRFIQAENDKIKEIAGTDLNKASILMDSAIVAPNGQPYTLTNDPKEAAKGENFILKEYDPNIRDVVYKISDAQTKAAENFIRANMRVKYNRVIKEEAISQPQRQESTETQERVKAKYRTSEGDEGPKITTSNIVYDNAKRPDGTVYVRSALQGLSGISVPVEGKNIVDIPEAIGYNSDLKALVIRGFQRTGTESEGYDEDVAPPTKEGEVGVKTGEKKTGTKTPRKIYYGKKVKNKYGEVSYTGINSNENGAKVDIIVRNIPNPEDPEGGNFQSTAQAKDYYRRKLNQAPQLRGKKESAAERAERIANEGN